MPKTHKNLFPQIIDFDNLLSAYYRARQGKKQTGEMRLFHFNLENNLWDLHDELQNNTYHPGAYRNFYIYEPKTRLVSAAPFRDRVEHVSGIPIPDTLSLVSIGNTNSRYTQGERMFRELDLR